MKEVGGIGLVSPTDVLSLMVKSCGTVCVGAKSVGADTRRVKKA